MMIKFIFVQKLCFLHSNFSILVIFYLPNLGNFQYFPSMDFTRFQNCEEYVGAGINTLVSVSDGIGASSFLSKDGKGASFEGKDGWKSCLFPARVGILTLML